MSNGDAILNKLEYKEHIKKMEDRELAEDTAISVYEVRVEHGKRLTNLEKSQMNKRRQATLTGSTTAGVLAIIIGIAKWAGWIP